MGAMPTALIRKRVTVPLQTSSIWKIQPQTSQDWRYLWPREEWQNFPTSVEEETTVVPQTPIRSAWKVRETVPMTRTVWASSCVAQTTVPSSQGACGTLQMTAVSGGALLVIPVTLEKGIVCRTKTVTTMDGLCVEKVGVLKI